MSSNPWAAPFRLDAGNNSFSVSVDVMKPDVKLGVGMLSDVLLNATFPEKASRA